MEGKLYIPPLTIGVNDNMSELPKYGKIEHHETVKKDLKAKVEAGEITNDQADEIYTDWLKERKA